MDVVWAAAVRMDVVWAARVRMDVVWLAVAVRHHWPDVRSLAVLASDGRAEPRRAAEPCRSRRDESIRHERSSLAPLYVPVARTVEFQGESPLQANLFR